MDVHQISISSDMMEQLMGAMILSFDGAIIDANDGALELYGLTPAEVKTLNLSDLEVDADSGAHIERLRAAADTWTVFRTEHLRKDGTAFPVEVMAVPVLFCGAPTVLSVVRDISELRHCEEALVTSREKILAVLDDTPPLTRLVAREEGTAQDR